MRYSFIVALVLFSYCAIAQETFKNEHFIEVTGTAEMEVDPNEITLLIRLKEFEENRTKTMLEKLDKDFMTALKSAGIEKKRLSLADVGSKLDKLGKKDKDAFREKTYQLILTSGKELEALLINLEPVKVDQVAITRVHHTELEKLKLDLKVKALQAARAKAEVLLKSIGSEIGKPIMVREWDNGPVHPYDMPANVMVRQKSEGMEMMTEQASPSFRSIRLQAQVSAQFKIQ